MGSDNIAIFLEQAIARQSWYRRYANTINAVICAIVGALAYLGTYWQATGSISTDNVLLSTALPVLTAFVMRLTKNGIGEVQAQRLLSEHAAQEHEEVDATSTFGFRAQFEGNAQ